jgi:uncharacterized protein YjbJ (UPF0337 family)
MSVSDKAKHAAEGAKGKVKEAVGKVTGDPDKQAEGQAEQDKAHAEHAADKAKETAENTAQRVKGKAREVAGAVTDDEGQEAKGKAEQLAARAKERLNK